MTFLTNSMDRRASQRQRIANAIGLCCENHLRPRRVSLKAVDFDGWGACGQGASVVMPRRKSRVLPCSDFDQITLVAVLCSHGKVESLADRHRHRVVVPHCII